MKAIFCAVFAVLAAVLILPFPARASDTSSDYRSITSLTEVPGEGIFFQLEGAKIVSGSSCTNRFWIDENDPSAAYWAAQIQSAYAGARRVSISYVTTTTACDVLVITVAIEE